MMIAGITAALLFCLFIGIETTLAVITLLILIGLASKAPILLVVLGIAIIAAIVLKKR